MKTISSLMFAVLLVIGSGSVTLCSSQVVAVGQISAEVIESVSASSNAVTSFTIGTPTASSLLSSGQAATASSSVNLGTMTINSGSNATVNVLLKSATLSNTQGNGFTLDPSLTNNGLATVALSNGSQSLQINGTANLNTNQDAGLYSGSYTVVFAYN